MYCHNRTITDTVVFKMTPIQSIAFVINLSKPNAQSTAEALADIAQAQGKKTQFITQYPLEIDCLKNVDLCCVIGGDGTLLGVLDASIRPFGDLQCINCGSSPRSSPPSSDRPAPRRSRASHQEHGSAPLRGRHQA